MNFSALNLFLPFAQLHRHRSLLGQFARRGVEQRHRGSFLGLIWTVVTPLLSLAVYTFVFGFVFDGRFTDLQRETSLDYALGIFLGLVLFNFLSEAMAQSPTVIVSQPNFVKKVVFPLEILPAATVVSAAVSGAISFVLALLGVAILGPGLDWHALLLFVIVPPVVLIAFGLAWFLSALGVFIRDIASAMPFLVQVLVYMSAVFYPMRLVWKAPEWLQNLLLLNPLLHAVESSRDAVLWHLPADPTMLVFLWTSGIVTCSGGYWVFHKLRPAFADVI
ncbi:MAG: ABC transporter permease [Verrucomicrobia bacterium]|nr:ABC transporter permease [Verrucomicrobiota bacterium]